MLVANCFRKHHIPLYHDNRISWESKFELYIHSSDQLPYIGDPDTFLVSQHGVSNHMKEITNNISMNSCILITSHLSNQHKIDTILKNIESLQDKNLPIVIVGNHPIPVEVQQKASHSMFVNYNPIVNRTSIAYYAFPPTSIGNNLRAINSTPDYGYAHLHQTLEGFKLCDSLGS